MIRRLILAVVAISPATAPAAAQSDTLPHPGYPPHATATGWVSSRYDAEQDRSILEMRRLQLDSSLSLTALVALEGRPVRKEAAGVTLTVWSMGPGIRLASDPRVALELDGRRAALRKLWMQPKAREPYAEAGLTGMDLNASLALANARHAALLVGASRFPLSDEFLTGLREFAARMRPTPTSNP